MKIIIEGILQGEEKKITYDLLDKYDEKTGIHSMARTTGYTATMVARMLAKGMFDKPGVNAPEIIGKDAKCVEYVLSGLEERGVVYSKSVE